MRESDRRRENEMVPESRERGNNIGRKEWEDECLRIQQDARAVIANFRGSFIRALLNLFPDIGLDERKFIFIRSK